MKKVTIYIKNYENTNKRKVGNETTRYYIELGGDVNALDRLRKWALSEMSELDPYAVDNETLGDAVCEALGYGTRYHFDKDEIFKIIDELKKFWQGEIDFEVIEE